ncbi:MAG TPA: hypothetical protein VMW51_09325 [Terriglobia bacterium]|nr:hypothetical protein [Terriglobia bacterium]
MLFIEAPAKRCRLIFATSSVEHFSRPSFVFTMSLLPYVLPFPLALTIATIPALTASGRRGQARITSAKSRSEGSVAGPDPAPDAPF